MSEPTKPQSSDQAPSSDYTILEGYNASELSSRVNNLLRRGWEPVGGVALAVGHEGVEEPSFDIWAQAMIKRG